MKKTFFQILSGLLMMGVALTVFAQETEQSGDNLFAQELEDVALNREYYIADILATWGTDPGIARDLETELEFADDEKILALLSAESMEAVRRILMGGADLPDGLESPTSLGDLYEDLVYTPVTPCRIVNTTIAGGPIAAGGTREFYVHGNNLDTLQGGQVSCPSPIGEPTGVHINIAVIPLDPTNPGNVRVYPANVSTPTTSVINFQPGVTIANAVTVKTAYNFGRDIEVYTLRRAQVVIDVMGYYGRPEKTKPAVTTVSSSGYISSSVITTTKYSGSCPSDYAWISGGAYAGGYEKVIIKQIAKSAQQTKCRYMNTSGSNKWVTCYAYCTRIPGR